MLVIEKIVVRYQELRALRGVSMQVNKGDLAAIIGSNGAGKTTLMNAVSGLVPVEKGSISFNGESLFGLTPDRICGKGVVQVPEGRKLFGQMTVEENLEIGAYLPAARARAKENRSRVFDLFPRLAERRLQVAGSLSGGEQQMLALGRALMAHPLLLMLDEPSLGLAPIVASEIFRITADLNAKGMTVLLVSQEVLHTLTIAGYAYLLENGTITLSGSAESLLADARVKESYLGL
ncbi:MAG: ABC transporter ATP-binding protein [Desulfomonilaceae bacterium]|nr:ABC transporter ATP-binding protein [Desulfomonilaceae bacterium]